MTDPHTEFRWSTLAVDCAALLGALTIPGTVVALLLIDRGAAAPLSAWLLAALGEIVLAAAWHRKVLPFGEFGERRVRREVTA